MPIDLNDPQALEKYKAYQIKVVKALTARFGLHTYVQSNIKAAQNIQDVAQVFSEYVWKLKDKSPEQANEIDRFLRQISETGLDLGWFE